MAAIELSDDVLASVASVSGDVTQTTFIEDALRREVERLRLVQRTDVRAAIHPATMQAVVSLSSRRDLIERVALRARYAVKRNVSQHPSWRLVDLRRTSEFSVQHFAIDELARGAMTIDDDSSVPELLRHWLDAPLSEAELKIKFSEVRRAMERRTRTFVARFEVSARVPLPKDVACSPPFGGATSINLISGNYGFASDAWCRELVAIEISVPQPDLPGYDLQPDAEFLFDQVRGNSIWPAFDHARVLLDYILTILRLKGVTVLYSDAMTSRGAPWMCQHRSTFDDGTTILRPVEIPAPSFISAEMFGHGVQRVCKPLRLNASALSDAFESARIQLAQYGSSPLLAESERHRRLLLIVERSAPRGMSFEEIWQQPDVAEVLARLNVEQPQLFEGISEPAVELPLYRHMLSHSQQYKDGIGFDVTEEKHRWMVRLYGPLLQQIAVSLVRKKLDQSLLLSVLERDVDVDEMVWLWDNRIDYCARPECLVQLGRTLRSLFAEGKTHDRKSQVTAEIDELMSSLL